MGVQMDANAVVKKICEAGLVAVVRAESGEQALKLTEACRQGGVAAIEITYTVPGASDVIRELARKYTDGSILIGAGTVLDPETARAAILAGSSFVVSPCLNKETAALCNRYGIPYMPGAMTVREVVECMEAGASIVKVFPGELLGPAFIKAVKGPLPHARMMPTGGVNLSNVSDWVKAGAVAVGVGGNLTQPAKQGDYAAVTRLAGEFVDAIRAARA